MTASAVTCGTCPARWTGTSRAHCSVCHHTFSSVSTFDRHQRGGVCHSPTNLGMDVVAALDRWPVYGFPATTRPAHWEAAGA